MSHILGNNSVMIFLFLGWRWCRCRVLHGVLVNFGDVIGDRTKQQSADRVSVRRLLQPQCVWTTPQTIFVDGECELRTWEVSQRTVNILYADAAGALPRTVLEGKTCEEIRACLRSANSSHTSFLDVLLRSHAPTTSRSRDPTYRLYHPLRHPRNILLPAWRLYIRCVQPSGKCRCP